jgi:hypothetical protein
MLSTQSFSVYGGLHDTSESLATLPLPMSLWPRHQCGSDWILPRQRLQEPHSILVYLPILACRHDVQVVLRRQLGNSAVRLSTANVSNWISSAYMQFRYAKRDSQGASMSKPRIVTWVWVDSMRIGSLSVSAVLRLHPEPRCPCWLMVAIERKLTRCITRIWWSMSNLFEGENTMQCKARQEWWYVRSKKKEGGPQL